MASSPYVRAHRPFLVVKTRDQWYRCAHRDTAYDSDERAIELAEQASAEPPSAEVDGPAPSWRGLCYDRWCRLYQVQTEAGQILRHRWGDERGQALFVQPDRGPRGEFRRSGPEGPLAAPTGVASSPDGRLFIAESTSGDIVVFDLQAEGLVRRHRGVVDPGPVDVVWVGDERGVLVGVGPNIDGRLTLGRDGRVRTEPWSRSWPASSGSDRCDRIAIDGRGGIYLLFDADTAKARVIRLVDFESGAFDHAHTVPHAGDIAVEGQGDERPPVVVVASRPGQPFHRVCWPARSGPEIKEPLKARGYDGRGIVTDPAGRITFFGDRGLRRAVRARRRYRREGRVVCMRLDAEHFQNRWGRIFIDACIPAGTELAIHTMAADEPPDEPAIAPALPENIESYEVSRPDLTSLPPASVVPEPGDVKGRVHRRAIGKELPWLVPSPAACERISRRFETYEAPVRAEPGRFLFLTLVLRGDGRVSPRVRGLRIETLGHPLVRRLPRLYSRDPTTADFLHRFLAMFDGLLGDLEIRTLLRHALFDPRSTPDVFLPWLADLMGLVLDRRWPESARRAILMDLTWLFRFRGTVPGLRRFLELYLGSPVLIVEHFRIRGLGRTVLGAEPPTSEGSVLGAGFRVGGTVGRAEPFDAGALDTSGGDAFESHAHRFTVVVPTSLDDKQRAVVELILEQHRPAHTLYSLCTLASGMRVGLGLHAGLTSVVGASGGFTRLQLGGSVLGRDGVVGRPSAGGTVGNARAGFTSLVT
ncbi:MAG: hypothetical protein K0V04_36280 [Deltaproteobacteria bacterium]|nr:hypothetical protein [Deltaproteobacteria bacterium]